MSDNLRGIAFMSAVCPQCGAEYYDMGNNEYNVIVNLMVPTQCRCGTILNRHACVFLDKDYKVYFTGLVDKVKAQMLTKT